MPRIFIYIAVVFSIVSFLFYVFCHSFSYLFLLIWKASNILNCYVATIVHALLLDAKPRFSCNDWERFQSYLLISYWFLIDHRLRSKITRCQRNCILWFWSHRQVHFGSVNTTLYDLLYYTQILKITLVFLWYSF